MKKTIGQPIFKWRQTEPDVILCAVRWYLRYSLSFRDVEELLNETPGVDRAELSALAARAFAVESEPAPGGGP